MSRNHHDGLVVIFTLVVLVVVIVVVVGRARSKGTSEEPRMSVDLAGPFSTGRHGPAGLASQESGPCTKHKADKTFLFLFLAPRMACWLGRMMRPISQEAASQGSRKETSSSSSRWLSWCSGSRDVTTRQQARVNQVGGCLTRGRHLRVPSTSCLACTWRLCLWATARRDR